MLRHQKNILLLLLLLASCAKDHPAVEQQRPENVLLISIDTLRPDALSIYGNRTRTPFFEEFARHSVVFDEAFTSAPITLPAHTSLLTGLYPPHHGVRNNGTFRAPQTLELLPEYAKRNGLATAAVVGGFPLAAPFGLNQGFDRYDDRFSKSTEAPGSFALAERNAESVVSAAEQWLAKLPKTSKYFLWLHFFDPHHPYLTHGFNAPSAYQEEVLYVDSQLQKFFGYLKQSGREANTLFIITADHGEAFGEHGESSHSLFVYNTTLHIPLLISYPGINPRREKSLARIVDITPTVLDVMGWKNDTTTRFDGASLSTLMKDNRQAPFQNYAETFAPALDFGWSPLLAIQDLHGKFIQAPHPEFYRLDQDPAESKNLADSADPSSYRAKLKAIAAQSRMHKAEYTPTAEERERLQSLGYFASPVGKSSNNPADPKDRLAIAQKIAELAMSPLGLKEKAVEYENLVKQDPDNPLLLLRCAEVELSLQNYEKAGALFQHVMDLEYFSPSVYNGMATVYFYRKEPAKAEQVLQTAVRLNVADGETYYNLGEFAFQRGESEKATDDYRHSMTFGFLPAFYRIARLQEIHGDVSGALQILATAEQRAADEAEVNNQRGMIYFRHGQFPAALAEFQKAYAKDSSQTPLLYSLGITYFRMNELDKARGYLTQFLKIAAADPELKDQRKTAQEILNSN
jgi:choline-sulfatase